MGDALGFAEHLVLGNPEGGLVDAAGEVVDFDAMELRERDVHHIAFQIKHPLVADDERECLVLQAAQRDVGLSEEVSRATRGVQEDERCETLDESAETRFCRSG